jgi:hypothetical protein
VLAVNFGGGDRGTWRLAGAVALSRACRDEDEDGVLVLGLIQRRGIVAVLGCEVALGHGLLLG